MFNKQKEWDESYAIFNCFLLLLHIANVLNLFNQSFTRIFRFLYAEKLHLKLKLRNDDSKRNK